MTKKKKFTFLLKISFRFPFPHLFFDSTSVIPQLPANAFVNLKSLVQTKVVFQFISVALFCTGKVYKFLEKVVKYFRLLKL